MKRLTEEQVRYYLCIYDPRYPDYIADPDREQGPAAEGCTCDNCYYRRHWMADTILAIRKVLGV